MNRKLTILVVSVLFVCLNVSIADAWWSGGGGGGTWIYRKQVSITSTAALTSFQVRIPFTSLGVAGLKTAGKLKTNCEDARFLASDDTTVLDYWMDSILSNYPSTKHSFIRSNHGINN